MRHGRLLAAANQAPEPLERLLGVVRLVLGLVADIARSSSEVLDTPVNILGQHFVTNREICEQIRDMSG